MTMMRSSHKRMTLGLPSFTTRNWKSSFAENLSFSAFACFVMGLIQRSVIFECPLQHRRVVAQHRLAHDRDRRETLLHEGVVEAFEVEVLALLLFEIRAQLEDLQL